jgi:hypothetical protein
MSAHKAYISRFLVKPILHEQRKVFVFFYDNADIQTHTRTCILPYIHAQTDMLTHAQTYITVGETKAAIRTVGWNWTNSRSSFCSPARETIAVPSPVHACADVAEKYARPYPPVASTVFFARKRCSVPSSRHSANTPMHAPSRISRSRAKYSMKYAVS